jgi:recombination protein RecR
MTDNTRDIEDLIDLMARLPGLGPRSARRAVLMLLKKRGQVMAPLAARMAHVATTARDCVVCGNIGTDDICAICADPARATGEICVVEDGAGARLQRALSRAGGHAVST